MFGFFENLLRVASEDRGKPTVSEPATVNSPPPPPLRYGDDIDALADSYGDLRGKTIDIELRDLLEIAPRERRRIEAYRGLSSELKKVYGCVLNITSRKTK